jgi:hypothetical protein
MHFSIYRLKNKPHDGVVCKCAFILELGMDSNNWELNNSKLPTQRLLATIYSVSSGFYKLFCDGNSSFKKIGIISEHLFKRSFKQFFKYLKNNKEKYLETITDPTVILFQFNFIALKYNLITGETVPFLI